MINSIASTQPRAEISRKRKKVQRKRNVTFWDLLSYLLAAAIVARFLMPQSALIAASSPAKPKSSAPNVTLASDGRNSGNRQPISRFFRGGAKSIVAKAVGTAEGTRTAEGGKTQAYSGHSDPGNGVWNLGSFSYQHGASSPEEADQKQLQILSSQAIKIISEGESHGLQMTLEEAMNGVDIGNQAPAAALGTGGYPECLKRAHTKGLTGREAIIWARTQSYWSPQKGRWDAPGLGNTEKKIRYDQKRRTLAVAEALTVAKNQLGVDPNQVVSPQALYEVAAQAYMGGLDSPDSADQTDPAPADESQPMPSVISSSGHLESPAILLRSGGY